MALRIQGDFRVSTIRRDPQVLRQRRHDAFEVMRCPSVHPPGPPIQSARASRGASRPRPPRDGLCPSSASQKAVRAAVVPEIRRGVYPRRKCGGRLVAVLDQAGVDVRERVLRPGVGISMKSTQPNTQSTRSSRQRSSTRAGVAGPPSLPSPKDPSMSQRPKIPAMFGDQPQQFVRDRCRIYGRIFRIVTLPIKAQDTEPRDADGADTGHVCSSARSSPRPPRGCSRARDHAAPGVRAQTDRCFVPVNHISDRNPAGGGRR